MTGALVINPLNDNQKVQMDSPMPGPLGHEFVLEWANGLIYWNENPQGNLEFCNHKTCSYKCPH